MKDVQTFESFGAILFRRIPFELNSKCRNESTWRRGLKSFIKTVKKCSVKDEHKIIFEH